MEIDLSRNGRQAGPSLNEYTVLNGNNLELHFVGEDTNVVVRYTMVQPDNANWNPVATID